MDDLERLKVGIRNMNKKMATIIEEDAKMYREFLENQKKNMTSTSTVVRPNRAKDTSKYFQNLL